MSNPVTIEDIYKLFQRSQEEADRRFAEADRRAAEAKAEADRRAAEAKAEADRRTAETEVRLANAEALVAQATQAVNSLTSRWGQFVENLVAPAVVRLFQAKGIAVHTIAQRVKASRAGRHLEIDILAVDDSVAVAIEVKSRLTQKGVQRCLENLSRFKTMLPQYRDYQIYGAVAAIEIDGDVDTYAENQGLFVIQQSGDSVCISNQADFTPRTW
ncbi:MAG: hypothetical protein AAF651_04360 [Cyanobacteria bacterium P01_C01_bin.73]